MDQMTSQELTTIRSWVLTRHPEATDLDLDTDLIENRLIDSLEFAEFLFVLEDVCGKAIDLHEVDLDTFRTLRSIESSFLRRN